MKGNFASPSPKCRIGLDGLDGNRNLLRIRLKFPSAVPDSGVTFPFKAVEAMNTNPEASFVDGRVR